MDVATEIMDWAWARHHNELSWHIRPLIIIAFCAAAWFRSYVGVISLALFFPISAVVFPAPMVPKPYVVDFLLREREMLETMTPTGLVGFVLLVALFLWALAACLWKRDFWLGVGLANLGGVIKAVTSILLWGETGMTVIVPTVLTALVVNGAAIAIWWGVLRGR